MIRQKILDIISESIRGFRKKGIFPEFDIPAVEVEKPEEKTHGDYSTNIAMILAGQVKKNSLEIAEKLESEILKIEPGLFEKIEAVRPGFINFWLSKREIERLFSEFMKRGEKFFQGKPKKQTIVIEYSSPNIAKPLGVHHLRSTIIGQALVNILRFAGYKVVSLSFPGDWGTQFGLLIAAYKKWGSPEKLKKNPIPEMLSLYVRFSRAAKENPEFYEEGRQEFKKLEEGNPENKKLWKWFTEESLKDFNRVYRILGVEIENTIGESYYEPELKGLIQKALKEKIAEYGKDSSIVVKLEESFTPEIIQKSDGATIYTTRELAAIRHRLKKWKASKIVYVAANQQAFHLNQVFGVAERLGIIKREQLVHVKFGMMLGPGGQKFATREGKLIPLEDLLKEAIERAKKVVEKLNPSLSGKEKEGVARMVGVGAVKFFDLSRNRLKDIIFDWNQMLNLKGFSAPYLQYTHARLSSILRKAGFKKGKNRQIDIEHPLERELAVTILRFDEVVEEVSQNYFPNQLAEYLYDLSCVVNNFYETLPVLKAEKKERESRLNLVYASREVLKTGLNLLGIVAPEVM